MMDETIHRLVPSTNRGRYALDDPEYGHDLTSGEPVALLLGGQWIDGRVEHSHIARSSTIRQQGLYVSQAAESVLTGYYFIAKDGHVCGLCTGMPVRLL